MNPKIINLLDNKYTDFLNKFIIAKLKQSKFSDNNNSLFGLNNMSHNPFIQNYNKSIFWR